MDKPVLLEVKDLKTYFYSGKHALKAVDSVSFSIREGEVFGLVGESGSGKSITCKSLIGLIHRPGRIAGGSIRYRGQELAGLSEKALTAVRGKEIGMIFQEPMVALNPVLRIGQQITESFKDPGLSGEEKHARAVELLRRVGIPNPEQRMREYPHQFSGGMRQRVVIAIALASNPKLLLADEPTTALDVTIQAQILQLLRELKDEYGMAMVLVTHNLGVAAQICDRIAVMYGGHIMELGPTRELFAHPQNPYTRGLLASLPVNKRKGEPLSAIPGTPPNLGEMPVGCPFAPRTCASASLPPSGRSAPATPAAAISRTAPAERRMTVENRNNAQEPLLQVRGLSLRFPVKQGLLDILMRRPQQAVTAVDDVDLAIYPGECLGLVGESGCGKSTLAKTIIRIYDPDAGTVLLDGVDFTALKGKRLQAARRSVQMVFQDPYSSLNPRMSVGAMLKEVLQVHHVCPKDEMDARVAALLEMVGLAPDAAQRSPGEFSGGQRQRIGIARTLALQPKLLIADEAVSALDVSVQAQIINLLEELQKSLHLTMLFISHDLSVVRCMTDRAVVMYLGKIMEMGPTEHLFGAPAHPYTRNLIDAVPEPDPDCPAKESTMIGEPPSPMDIPGGCRFHPRCPYAKNVCRRAQPELTDLGGGHFAACHFPYACAGVPQTEAEQ